MADDPSLLGPVRRMLVSIFSLVSLAIILGAITYAKSEDLRIRHEKYGDLATITNLKKDQILQWRKERLADVWRAANGPRVITLLAQWTDKPDDPGRDELKKLLEINLKGDLYDNVCLVGPDGVVLLAARDARSRLCLESRRACQAAVTNARPVLSELCREDGGPVHIDAIAAVPCPGRDPGVVMVLQSRAETGLFPLLQNWPIPSESAEVMLVRREGESALVLNDLRHQAHAALDLKIPLANTRSPAVRAVLGMTGLFLGLDYRNQQVLAELSQISGTDWALVTKVNAVEILEEVRYRNRGSAIVAALFILLAGAVSVFVFRHQQAVLFKGLYQSEREKRAAQESFRTTFHSIGDAVITTDTGENVREMNPMAETLTGWSREEALGKPLETVFRIIHEETQLPGENPVKRVLRERKPAEMANHSLLLSRNGATRPIADSAAPIRGDDGLVTGVVLVFRDQTAERASQNALRDSEARLRFALEATKLGAWDLDMATHTAQRTPIHDTIFGYDAPLPSWTYEMFLEHVQPEDRADVDRIVREAGQSGSAVNFECRIRRTDGERRWIWVAGSPQKDASGTCVRLTGIVQDITDRKRREEQLRITADDLARSNRELEQFAYVAAHDLREPLRMISAFASLLRQQYRGRLDETADQYIGFALDGAERMSALIVGLLEYARVGKRDNLTDVSVEKPIREALANLKPMLDEAGGTVEVGPMPVIRADEIQVRQLFQNLIGNAVKFRGKDPPRIRLSATPQNSGWHFAVEDNGIGIEPAYWTRIFEVFQRLHTRDEYPGTGIGLAICKKIVESHGGRIWVESRPGAGSTFHFTIP